MTEPLDVQEPISDIFQKDPNLWSDQDLLRIVNELAAKRQSFLVEEQAAKSEGRKVKKSNIKGLSAADMDNLLKDVEI